MGFYVSAQLPVLQGGPLTGHDQDSFAHPPIASAEDWDSLLAKTWAEAEAAARLIGQVPALASVAARLHVSVRTLQLHLKAAGHSYQELLNDVRRALAQRHLREAQLSITDIAFLPGYAELSVFGRSFRKWTGQTPGAFRRP